MGIGQVGLWEVISTLGIGSGPIQSGSNPLGWKTRISWKCRGILYICVRAGSFEAREGIGRDSVGF